MAQIDLHSMFTSVDLSNASLKRWQWISNPVYFQQS